MVFGINISPEEFAKLRDAARDKGYKSTEGYIKHLINMDLGKGTVGEANPLGNKPTIKLGNGRKNQ